MIGKEVFSERKKLKTIIACFERGTLSPLQCLQVSFSCYAIDAGFKIYFI